jgi:hypothetical protein
VSAFEIVLIVVAVVALALAATGYFRNALSKLGEDPAGFAHPDDRPISDQPSEDERDEPLPKRPPRGRGF